MTDSWFTPSIKRAGDHFGPILVECVQTVTCIFIKFPSNSSVLVLITKPNLEMNKQHKHFYSFPSAGFCSRKSKHFLLLAGRNESPSTDCGRPWGQAKGRSMASCLVPFNVANSAHAGPKATLAPCHFNGSVRNKSVFVHPSHHSQFMPL